MPRNEYVVDEDTGDIFKLRQWNIELSTEVV